MDFSRTSTARVPTDRPARYGKQLASHMSRKITTAWDEETGSGSLLFNRDGQTTGSAELTSEPNTLVLTLHADDDHLEHLEDVIGRHLVRFGSKDELVVSWVRDDGRPGTTQRPSDETHNA